MSTAVDFFERRTVDESILITVDGLVERGTADEGTVATLENVMEK